MKKICMSLVCMFSMLQLSASQDNSIVSTMVFTTSVAFIAWIQQPVWVKQLAASIEKTFENNDTIMNVEQLNLDDTDKTILTSQDQEIEIDAVPHQQKSDDESQNYLSNHCAVDDACLNSKNQNHVDYDEEVHSLLSSSMVYVTPSHYSEDICL